MHKSSPEDMAGDEIPVELLQLYMQRLTAFMTLMKAAVSPATRLMFRTTAMPRYSNCRCQCNETSWSMGRPAQVTELNQAGREAARQSGLEVVDFDMMLHRFHGADSYLKDSIHPKDPFLLTALNVALNMLLAAKPL